MIYANSKLLKYLMTGGVNTAFGYIVYAISIFIGFSYSNSLLISTVLGVCFNYVTFGKIVFGFERKWYIFFKFVFCYVFVYFFNVTLLSMFITSIGVDPYLSQIFCIVPTVIINWFLFNNWVYKFN